MHWLFLLLSIGALALGFLTTSMPVLLGCLLLSLLLFIAWVVAMYRARVAGSGRDELSMIDAAELRRLRDVAEARRQADAADDADDADLPTQ